ncbi:MAG: SMC-Scp complex subunit ScpB [Chloroflexota bacterium]|nr:MAG: SMC-Scp complex subunit ScpB [Chloroflexota bacterium]
MSDIKPLEKINELKAGLEAILFVAPVSVNHAQLAAALQVSEAEVEQGLKLLSEDYKTRGLRIQRHAGRIQLTTSPEVGEVVERFLGLEITSHLSQAALEALSIVAYQQPVTRPQVDSIRGVNSDGVMKSLLHKGLIQDVGRAPGPGRPILYASTPEFLQHFGLSSLEELPPLELDQESQTQGDETDNNHHARQES